MVASSAAAAAATTTAAAARRFVLGGVPEHFNVCLIKGIEAGLFAQRGLEVSFRVCHGGTGEQLKLLADGELDGCVALTEGLVSGLVARGGPAAAAYRLLGTYVQTPLTWAVATHPDSAVTPATLRGARIGVSRFHSGSHLIPYLHAQRHGWLDAGAEEPFEFAVNRDFAGLRAAIAARDTDAFLWEVATTQRYFDDGSLRCAGTVVPTWPAFSLAIANASAADGAAAALLDGVRASLAAWHALDDGDKVAAVVETIPSYAPKDVRSWLAGVRFAADGDVAAVDAAAVREIVDMLVAARVIEAAPECPLEDFVAAGGVTRVV
ncbi:hypothetical protein H9P43_008255 [Blastocladiella emersonii ATCC 22665]|nr:hypothetical protein H9P43_008255 [Blastocladiella emersonii ATCC 22665]